MDKVSRARCKFTVTLAEPMGTGAPGNEIVKMSTQYDPELSKEDAAFNTATPWGNMEFSINNPNLAGFFQQGKAYYIDITPAE